MPRLKAKYSEQRARIMLGTRGCKPRCSEGRGEKNWKGDYSPLQVGGDQAVLYFTFTLTGSAYWLPDIRLEMLSAKFGGGR